MGLLQSWVESGLASIVINSVRYRIDPSCSTSLDSPSAFDCVITSASSSTPSQNPTTSSSSPSASAQNLNLQGRISSGEIGGLVVGVFIAVLLLLFVVLLAILIYRSIRGTKG